MDLLEYYNVIAYTSAFSVVIPLSLSIYRLKNLNSVNRILLLYLSLSFGTEIINFVLLINGISNIFSIELFKVAELFLITYIFTLANIPAKNGGLVIIFGLVAALLLFLVDLRLNTTMLFNGLSHCIIMALCFRAFYRMLDMERNISNYYFFWITTGILFYFSISFFLFLLNDFTRSLPDSLAKNLWLINLVVNIFYYMFLSLGIWKINSKSLFI